MTSPDFASSEHRVGHRRLVAVVTDLETHRSCSARAAGGGRSDLTGVRGLDVGTQLMSDTTVASFAGEIDLVTMEQFAGALRMHLNDGASFVVIDLTEVSFVSVGGVRVLLTALRQARRRGVVVRVSLSPAAHRVVTLFRAITDREAGSGPSPI
jgi:anti-anti-sigma factor